MSKNDLIKYPRTRHIEGSKLQAGDEDLSQIPFKDIAGKFIVVEEKCDGANSAISFDEDGEILLQSRGHYLTGGYRERHYNLMKQWASIHQDKFFDVLEDRYIMYGEWMYAKHTVFYDKLPAYFLEFDIFDKVNKVFLDTPSRHNLIKNLPIISVPVLKSGIFNNKKDLISLIGKSNYISDNPRENLSKQAIKLGLDPIRACNETELSGLMEGLYIKVEENGIVIDRMKYVRNEFLQSLFSSDSHWIDRPIIQNQLAIPIEKIFED